MHLTFPHGRNEYAQLWLFHIITLSRVCVTMGCLRSFLLKTNSWSWRQKPKRSDRRQQLLFSMWIMQIPRLTVFFDFEKIQTRHNYGLGVLEWVRDQEKLQEFCPLISKTFRKEQSMSFTNANPDPNPNPWPILWEPENGKGGTHQSMNMPTRQLVGFPAAGSSAFSSYRPFLAPSIRVATNPAVPPTRCTPPEPAMSMQPIFAKNPFSAQIQWAGMQYTTVLMNEKIMYALSFVLSAMAPDTMVVAVVAKDNWKMKVENVSPMESGVASTIHLPIPMNPLVPSSIPKLSPYPKAQYVSPPKMTSTAFFTMMFTSFFAETDPASKRPNPEIKHTNGKLITSVWKALALTACFLQLFKSCSSLHWHGADSSSHLGFHRRNFVDFKASYKR